MNHLTIHLTTIHPFNNSLIHLLMLSQNTNHFLSLFFHSIPYFLLVCSFIGTVRSGIKTCFYHDMDPTSKAWLEFIFPAYVNA